MADHRTVPTPNDTRPPGSHPFFRGLHSGAALPDTHLAILAEVRLLARLHPPPQKPSKRVTGRWWIKRTLFGLPMRLRKRPGGRPGHPPDRREFNSEIVACIDRLQRLEPETPTVEICRVTAAKIAEVWGLDAQGTRKLATTLAVYASQHSRPADPDAGPH